MSNIDLLIAPSKKRKMLIDIKTIVEDIIKIGKKNLKERSMIDIEKMTLSVSNVVKKDILINTITSKEG